MGAGRRDGGEPLVLSADAADTGYIISTSAGDGISIFGWLEVPAIITAGEAVRDLAIELHYWLAYGTAGLAIVHALAALKHQFMDHDGMLRRMLW
jgi:cytochrome b561